MTDPPFVGNRVMSSWQTRTLDKKKNIEKETVQSYLFPNNMKTRGPGSRRSVALVKPATARSTKQVYNKRPRQSNPAKAKPATSAGTRAKKRTSILPVATKQVFRKKTRQVVNHNLQS